MNKLLIAALVTGVAVPQLAFAAEKSGKVKNWFAATRNVILVDNTECYLGADIKDVPAALAVGKDVMPTYSTDKNINTCTKIEVK
ncbi:MAG: hypothetical protein EXQ88_03610 [Alphaproteobacteria bacterium]|nr:hypothetical protein [Alphaproteobacteria bacterium]